MSQPEPASQISGQRYGRYVGLLGVLLIILITVNTLLTKPNGATGIEVGHRVPPFAVPLALDKLEGDANVATHAKDGEAGKRAACTVRGPEILNVCQLYGEGPVVLALFVNSGACPGVLYDMQRISSSFPQVRFAAVAIKGTRRGLRKFVRAHQLSLPIGFDKDGALVELYKVASCPQISFIYPGGVVQSKSLLIRAPLSTLRARVSELLSATKARNLLKPA